MGTYMFLGVLSIFYISAVLYLRRPFFNKKRGTILVSLFLLSLSLLFLYITFSFPEEEGVGPATVPRLWIGLLILFNIFLIYRVVRGIEGPDEETGDPWKTLKFIVLMTVYIGLLDIIGYFIDTFLFLIIAPLMLYYKRIVNLIAISVIWVVFVYYVFVQTLHIPIPLGFFAK